MSAAVVTRRGPVVASRPVGGFDAPPCDLCRREEPCRCGGRANCACSCGRCLYPHPLPDDGPCMRRQTGWP